MALLGPAINSMYMVFQIPEGSAAHWMVHLPPTCWPPVGVSGSGPDAARTYAMAETRERS
jgi:hypothetical protein